MNQKRILGDSERIAFLWRSDVHISDRGPQSRTDDWMETILGKLQFVGKVAQEQGVVAVLDGGDFFDTKSPFRNSHNLVRAVADVHKGHYGSVPTYSCIGNHDCVYGDYSYIDQQPLGVLFASKVFHRLYDGFEVVFSTSDGSITVRVVGVPYHGQQYDMERLKRIKKGKETYLVVVAHLLASPSGGSMFEGEDVIKYKAFAELDADVVCLGHWHKYQGITEIAPKKYIVNVGSLSRGALSMDNVDRIPEVVILNFTKDGISFDEIPVPIRPFAEVFDVIGKEKREARADMMGSFVDRFQQALTTVQQEDLKTTVQKLKDVPDRVRERMLVYLETTRAGRV